MKTVELMRNTSSIKMVIWLRQLAFFFNTATKKGVMTLDCTGERRLVTRERDELGHSIANDMTAGAFDEYNTRETVAWCLACFLATIERFHVQAANDVVNKRGRIKLT